MTWDGLHCENPASIKLLRILAIPFQLASLLFVALADYAMQTGRKRTALRLLDNYLEGEAGAAASGTRLAALRESLRSRN